MLSSGLVAVVLLLIAAAPAIAADVRFDGGGMTISSTAGESSRLTVTFEPNIRATVHDDAGGLRPGLGCIGTPSDVTCGGLGVLGQCHPCSARIDLADGNDTLILAGTSEPFPFAVEAGTGDDDVHVLGDANATVHGGPGRDVLRADGSAELDGGDGPDVLQGDGAYASYAGRAVAVNVTLDGAANDGAAGEGDNVITGGVIGGEGADTLTGNGAANMLSGRGGDDILRGAGGADTLRGDTGTNRIDAGAGDDRVDGSPGDTVRCGAGADVAAGLAVPGAHDDCETVFESTNDEPYLTVSDISVSKRRPRVMLDWHEYPGIIGPPVSASGTVELRWRGKLIARGAFPGTVRPAPRAVILRLNARGKALACRSARRVRLLAVASGEFMSMTSRSAIRRDARLPRVGTCAKKRAKPR